MTDIFKKNYSKLPDEINEHIMKVKSKCEELYTLLDVRKTREMSLAKTKLEECSMWATKALVVHYDEAVANQACWCCQKLYGVHHSDCIYYKKEDSL